MKDGGHVNMQLDGVWAIGRVIGRFTRRFWAEFPRRFGQVDTEIWADLHGCFDRRRRKYRVSHEHLLEWSRKETRKSIGEVSNRAV